MTKLFEAFKHNGLSLRNHIVMAPMTRSRAINNLPNALMAEYYEQRSSAGLIITEGTAPSPEALGYPSIPGIYNQEQVEGWKLTTQKVHNANGKIFMQLMHTGRIGHNDNLPAGAEVVGVSDLVAPGQIFTSNGMKDHSQPRPLSLIDIQNVIDGFVSASQNAIEAGFDGIEIHGANGYLVEQFLNPNVNTRTDEYGGSIKNRARFTIELVTAITNAIGKEKVGIRFSPYSTLGGLAVYDQQEVQQTYAYLAQEINKLGIAYLHIAVNAVIPPETFSAIRKNFAGTIILCNGLTAQTAEAALHAGFADLVGFGRGFLANPDFVERIRINAPLNQMDTATSYSTGAKGYTDYPTLAQVTARSL